MVNLVPMKKTIFFIIAISGMYFGYSQKNKIDLTYIDNASGLGPDIQKGFAKIVHTVYPELLKDFNPDARKDITIFIDTDYDGVAYANDGRVTVSSKWLTSHPEDLDLMTHEIMHIIQAYPPHSGPGWLTEGIADYVRYKYGLDNDMAGWSLTPFNPKQHYTNSYRITARFLAWITQNYDKDLVKKMDARLREKQYSENLWKEYTGKTLDQLWEEYSKNPVLS
tara:strand:- start:10861 stop:11529 length:669 start_codon:yes stop_codon:yes gene_type:complete